MKLLSSMLALWAALCYNWGKGRKQRRRSLLNLPQRWGTGLIFLFFSDGHIFFIRPGPQSLHELSGRQRRRQLRRRQLLPLPEMEGAK
jgi:hypothetical protein